MPKAPDKVLLNRAFAAGAQCGIDGRFDEIHCLLEAAEEQGEELINLKLIDEPEQDLFLKRKEGSCAALDAAADVFKAAQDQYIKETKGYLDDQRLWIDRKRAMKP